MKRPSIILLFLIVKLSVINSTVWFIAPNGLDINPGTWDHPLSTIQKAQEIVSAGDTVYIRGGEYLITESQISRVEQNLFACISYLDKSGLPGMRINYWAYPGENPVFDFSEVKPANQRVVGIWVTANWVHIRGMEMTGVQVTIKTHTAGETTIYLNRSICTIIRARDYGTERVATIFS